MTDPTWAIVLAAGIGARFGQRKQFVEVDGQRLVDLAVGAARRTCDRVVLVLPAGVTWDGPAVDVTVVGGPDRSASLRSGLAAIRASSGIVLVHQAANPLASPDLIRRLLAVVEGGAAAVVPGLRPADLVRRTSGDRLGEVVGRDDLVLVQTPAAFQLAILRDAHERCVPSLEDTALITQLGHEVVVVPGDPANVHVALPEDLELVRALLVLRGR